MAHKQPTLLVEPFTKLVKTKYRIMLAEDSEAESIYDVLGGIPPSATLESIECEKDENGTSYKITFVKFEGESYGAT